MGDYMGDNDDFDILSDSVLKLLERIYLILALSGLLLMITEVLS